MYDNASTATPLSFWSRQFSRLPTSAQITFDFIVGALLPFICFILDPIVFKGNGISGGPLFSSYRVFAYHFSALEIALLCYWLFQQRKSLNPLNGTLLNGSSYAFLSGSLFAGALFCFLMGIVLLPYSLLGMLIGIGFLGFSPFVVGLVYLRNAIRVKKQGDIQFPENNPTGPLLAGVLLIIAFPLATNLSLNTLTDRSINSILYGDQAACTSAVTQLKFLRFTGVNTDRLVLAYENAPDEKRAQIASSYYQLTNQDIVDRLRILND